MMLVSDIIEKAEVATKLSEADKSLLESKRLSVRSLCKFVYHNHKLGSIKSIAQQLMLPERIVIAAARAISQTTSYLESFQSEREDARFARARQIARYAAALSQPFYVRVLSEFSGTPEKALLSTINSAPDIFEPVNEDLGAYRLKIDIVPIHREQGYRSHKHDIRRGSPPKAPPKKSGKCCEPRVMHKFYKNLTCSYMNEEFRSRVSSMIHVVKQIWEDYRKGWPGADRSWRRIVRHSAIIYAMYCQQDIMAIGDMLAIDPSRASTFVRAVYNQLEATLWEIDKYYQKYGPAEDDSDE